MRSKSYVLWILFGILLLAVYGSLFTADFLPWDDDYNISINPIYSQGSLLSLWKQAFYGMYIPLTSTVWGFLFRWGEGQALPFRIFNFSIHCLNVVLVSRVLRDWIGKLQIKPASLWFLGTAIFALHPLQVETVAWISGGRDLLATSFALTALWIFFRWPTGAGFALGGILFVLGLLSKPQVSSLPLVIFLLSLVDHPENWKKTATQMFIWALPVLAVATLTFNEQKQYVAKTVEAWQRPLIVFDSFGFYFMKSFAPFSLSVDYGRTPEFLWNHFSQNWLPLFLSLGSLVALGLLYFFRRHKILPLLFLSWLACLLPISGLVDFAYQDISTTADHYAYFPMFAFSLLFVFSIHKWRFIHSRWSLALFIGLISSLTVLSALRAQVWRDRYAFFEDMLRKNPSSYSALIGMGGNSALQGENEKALLFYQQALEQRPDDVAATANILSTLFRLKKYSDVMSHEDFLLHSSFQKTMTARHIATANILSTFGVTSYVLENLDLSLLYLCEAFAINPYNSAVQQGYDAILKIVRQKDPQRNCPSFETDADFFEAVKLSIASRNRR